MPETPVVSIGEVKSDSIEIKWPQDSKAKRWIAWGKRNGTSGAAVRKFTTGNKVTFTDLEYDESYCFRVVAEWEGSPPVSSREVCAKPRLSSSTPSTPIASEREYKCGIGCPTGYYPREYTKNPDCGFTGGGPNETVCIKLVDDRITVCGSCPAGYEEVTSTISAGCSLSSSTGASNVLNQKTCRRD